MRKPTLRHHLEYLAYRATVGILRILPERVAFPLGEGLGWVVGVVLGIRRRTVRDHLRLAFPDREESWRRQVARASFRHLGREGIATFRMGRGDPGLIRERTRMEGFEALEEVVGEGRGAIIVTGHFGNWEIGGASVAVRGIPLEVVAQRQRNPLFDRDLNRNRERLSMTVIERGEAPRKVVRALRKGRVVAIVGDQNVRKAGVFVDFFGRKASTARGAAVFALRTESPIFLGIARREPGFPQRYRVTLERVEFSPSGDMGADALRLTAVHTRRLEEEVRKTPEQYFWQHRRWKTRPAEESGPL